MGGARDAEVGLELLIDVRQAAGKRADVPVDGERQPDRMPGGGVRVLADDQHPHVGQRALESPQHAVPAGR
nr:hypothetical protein GCM10025699_20660 [Microbacterium flavescens]